MSLTSRLSSLVSPDPSSHAQSHAPTLSSEQNGFALTLFEPGSIRQNTGSRTMETALEEDLEAKRPPYWHVSVPFELPAKITNVCSEHAGRWHRRDQRRYCYAFTGYCENETARGSPFSTKIHKPVKLIRHNISTRGPAEGAIWRLWSCYAGIVPGHSSFLWLL